MSGAGARANQNAVRSKAGVMTAAALFYLSGAMETEAEPAASDQTTTEQAPTPAPQQTRTGAKPVPRRPEQKSDTLPTVSVQASRPRAPAAVRAAPSRPVAAPPPPAQPVATRPGRIGRLQSASRPDPLSSHQYRHHAAAGADPQHAADRQRHPAGDHPGAERHHGRAGPAIHPRHHLQRRRRRASKATARSSAASSRAATCSATASAIPAGIPATRSRSTASRSTRARRRSRSAAARPAAPSTT